MNFPRPSSLLALALTAVLGVGCLNLKPQPDLTRFYVLSSPLANEKPAAPPPTDALPLFLGRVEIPDYLQNSSIATRLDETEVHFSHDHRWAESLRDGVTRVLRDALAARCGPDRVHPATFRRPGGSYLEIQVALTQFECTAQGAAVVAARWSLLRQPDAERLAGGERVAQHEFAYNPDDYRSAVEGLSRGLAELGAEIAEPCLEPAAP